MNKTKGRTYEQVCKSFKKNMDSAYTHFRDACIAELVLDYGKTRGVPADSSLRIDEFVPAEDMSRIIEQAKTTAERLVRDRIAEMNRDPQLRGSADVLLVWECPRD